MLKMVMMYIENNKRKSLVLKRKKQPEVTPLNYAECFRKILLQNTSGQLLLHLETLNCGNCGFGHTYLRNP